MNGAPEREQLILDHAAATDTQLKRVFSFHQTQSDEAQR
jgi:hypothetical protein